MTPYRDDLATLKAALDRADANDRRDRVLAEVRMTADTETCRGDVDTTIPEARMFMKFAAEDDSRSRQYLLRAAACVVFAIEAEDRRAAGEKS